MEKVECVVIGAGVVGIAIARHLAKVGRDVLLLEAETTFGSQTSSRNSEVIHAGIYYPSGSQKAVHCVRGKNYLYQYCTDKGIPFQRCGKLVVATHNDQVPVLMKLVAQADENGVHDLQFLSASEVQALEPAANAVAGVLSPSTGIIDSHAYMLAMIGDFEAFGGTIAYRSAISGGAIENGKITLHVGSPVEISLQAKTVINCAGLQAISVARSIQGLPAHTIPTPAFAKGSYFAYQAPVPFKHLIYPVPEPGGLGIHLTKDLANQARFGPDVEWISKPDFEVDSQKKAVFLDAIRRYWPDVRPEKLTPDFAGIRPKIGGAAHGPADFILSGPAEHGISGVYNLYGIESPGLTSSLSIAESIALHAAL